MRFSVDPWDPGYGTSLNTELGASTAEVDVGVELPAERWRPLEAYRAEELALMKRDIFDDRRGFAAARYAFVNKRTRSPGRDAQSTSTPMSMPGPSAA